MQLEEINHGSSDGFIRDLMIQRSHLPLLYRKP